eukprot:TRINITY_DN18621_c0_g1_i1.p1 TRINITY_DN18621_c0_g1~~TRINITY_DN18621_c0_g1_i1.p1  ORF type:complete len:802 (+),score=266.97 TRINITY_DN18621_c0_g1_i1:59-2464(+)
MAAGADVFTEGVLVGCSVGDTNAVCAVWEPRGRSVDVVINSRGQRLTPSAAYYHAVVASAPPQVFVGDDALTREARQGGGLIRGVKMFVGVSPQEVDMDEVAAANPRVTSDATNTRLVYRARIGMREGEVPVERLVVVLAEAFLARVKTTHGVDRVTQGVFAAPVYYTLPQRAMLQRCLAQALPNTFIAAEPLAAVVGSGHFVGKQATVLVVDVGGHALTASIVDVDSAGGEEAAPPEKMALAVRGASCDLSVGGAVVDAAMLAEAKALYQDAAGAAMPEKVARKLGPQLEELKRGGKGDVDIDLPDDASQGEVEYRLTGAKLSAHAAPLVAACRRCVEEALASGGGGEVGYVLLAGGSSRLPHIKALCQELVPDADVVLGGKVLPEEVVAAGAATLGSYLLGQPRDTLAADDAFLSLTCYPAGASPLPAPPPRQAVPVAREKLLSTLALRLVGGDVDAVAVAGAQLPLTTYRYYAAGSAPAVVTLLAADDGGEGEEVGSLVVDPPRAGAPGPSVCVKVSVAVSGVVELLAYDVDDEADAGGAGRGPGKAVFRTAPLQALDPNARAPAAAAKPVGEARPPAAVDPTPEPVAAAPSPSPSPAPAADAPGVIGEDDELLLVDLSDRFQALDWFFRAKSLSTVYAAPEARLDPIAAAMREADRVSQDTNATGADARAALQALHAATGVTVGPPDRRVNLMAIALGLWQFAVAPQEDDTELLRASLDAGTPVEHVLGANGHTVLHEIAAHGAMNCLAALAGAVDAAAMQTLLQTRTARDHITPLELAALDHREAMVAALSRLKDP